MAETATEKVSNWEGALNPFTNTFDRLRADIDSILAQQDQIIEQYPDQATAIKRMAVDQIHSILADAGVSPDSYRAALQTEKQYSLPFSDSPHTYVKGIARALGQGLFLGAGDELEAFVTHMIKNKMLTNEGNEEQTYMEVLADIQAGISAFERKNPGVSLTSEIIGGLYFPGYTAGVRAARGLYKGSKMLRQEEEKLLHKGLLVQVQAHSILMQKTGRLVL